MLGKECAERIEVAALECVGHLASEGFHRREGTAHLLVTVPLYMAWFQAEGGK